ncbi:3-keto-5-aminohexanoate cleavage protein [Roseomonas sp. CCTCC AB2023176]|uniref:3-keto-5-aminohexanoate cleavage protein n=1 Tax=Roseomonas sp. CCTCC AB2023176 TaxID=3342640 RepID=UPI0035DF364B
MASKKVIVTVAPTSNFHGKDANPALPEQPEEIGICVRECADAGASLAHLHARNPDGTQSNSAAVFRAINAAVRARSDIIVQNSSAPAMGKLPGVAEDGWQTLDALPEMASLDMGVCTISLPGREHIIEWTRGFLEKTARTMLERGIKAEMEIFNNSHMANAEWLIERRLLEAPYSYSFVMNMHRVNQSGMAWHPKTLSALVDTLPRDALFSTLGVGPSQHPATVMSLILGGGVRVGFEDNIFYRRGELARSNAHLVERIVTTIRDFGLEPATPVEAREILGLPPLGSAGHIETHGGKPPAPPVARAAE